MGAGRTSGYAVKVPLRGLELAAVMQASYRSDLSRRFKSCNYDTAILVLGTSIRVSDYRREMHYTIEMADTLNIPRENIIGVDINLEALMSWETEGITLIHGDWNSKEVFDRIETEYSRIRTYGKALYKMVYFDSWGSNEDTAITEYILNKLRPHRFFSFHATRSAGSVETRRSWYQEIINNLPLIRGNKYSFANLGELSPYDGFLTYRTGMVACLKLWDY